MVTRGDSRGRNGSLTVVVYRNKSPIAVVRAPRTRHDEAIREEHANMIHVSRMFPREEESPLPPVFGTVEIAGKSFLVIGLVQGKVLSSFFGRAQSANRRAALRLGPRVSSWLKFFHTRGMIYAEGARNPQVDTSRPWGSGPTHGDPLCRNIVITDNGRLCVIDWRSFSVTRAQIVDLMVFLIDLASWTLGSDKDLISEMFLSDGGFYAIAREVLRAYDGRMLDGDTVRSAVDAYLEYARTRSVEIGDPRLQDAYANLETQFKGCEHEISFT